MSDQVKGDVAPSGPLTVIASAIAVTPDTIRAVLHERKSPVGGAAVAAWFGISITIWAAYFSATFHDAIGIKATVIETVFLISGIISIILTIVYFTKYLWNKNSTSVDSIVKEITDRSKPKIL